MAKIAEQIESSLMNSLQTTTTDNDLAPVITDAVIAGINDAIQSNDKLNKMVDETYQYYEYYVVVILLILAVLLILSILCASTTAYTNYKWYTSGPCPESNDTQKDKKQKAKSRAK